MTGRNMVRKHIDTVDALMAHYVAGTLPEPARILVAAHLEMKPDHRQLVCDLDCLAGEMLEQADPAPIPDRDRRLAEIFASAPPVPEEAPAPRAASALFPRILRDFLGFEAEDVPWRTKLPGFRHYVHGTVEGCATSLMWVRAGRALPSHSHRGLELTLVIDGAFSDVRGRFGPGDISLADENLVHRPVAGKDGPCIAFSVMAAPIRLTGPLTQLIGDIIG